MNDGEYIAGESEDHIAPLVGAFAGRVRAGELNKVAGTYGHAAPLVKDGLTALTNAMTRAQVAATELRASVAYCETNRNYLPTDGRRNIEAEARAAAQRAAQEVHDQAQAGAQLVKAGLQMAATPKPPKPDAEPLLRDELRTLLDGRTGSELRDELTQIAEGPRRDLAGLLVGPWGQSYLRSRGMADLSDLVALKVAHAAARYGTTDTERLAGSLLADFPQSEEAAAAVPGSYLSIAARQKYVIRDESGRHVRVANVGS